MELEEVKYRNCKNCGKPYPRCDFVPSVEWPVAGEPIQGTYRVHRRSECNPCLRREMERLKRDGSQKAKRRYCQIEKSLVVR